MWELWEYIDHRGNGVLTTWALQRRERIKLDEKLELLRNNGPDRLARSLVMYLSQGIWKMKVRGNAPLRPLFCRGPIDTSNEITFLAQAIERGNRLLPAGVVSDAMDKMKVVEVDSSRRVRL